jgi:hypothetical protein
MMGATTAPLAAAAPSSGRAIPLSAFKVIGSESGDVNYYTLVTATEPYIRGAYRPPWKTAVLGYRIPEQQRRSIAALQWKWRAVTLPRGGDECADGKGDSAAVVYVTWKSGLKWYSVKYVWSAVGQKGKTCDRKRNPFRAQDTVIVESGPPLDEWRSVRIDPDTEFRNHFENGDRNADVPNLVGIGIMTDGDQTRSASAGDYSGFLIVPK